MGQSFLPYDGGLISFRERYRGLRDYHKKLIALRKDIPSLHSRLWQLFEAEPASQVLAYLRFLEGNEQPVLVLLNFSSEPAEVKVSVPRGFSSLTNSAPMQDLLNDERVAVEVGDGLKVTVPGYGVRLLTAQS